MAYELSIDEARECGTVTVHGVVTADVLIEATKHLHRHPSWSPDYCELWDLRKADSVDIQLADFRRIVETDGAEMQAGLVRLGRTAIVVRKALHTAVPVLYKHSAAPLGYKVQVFTDMEEAVAWLNTIPDQ